MLESQTEGMEISKVSQVSAVLTRDTDKEQVEEMQLDMLETGEIVLPDLKTKDIIELFVVYEGPYTEFDYRVCRPRPLL
jgi:hypothetical protein